MGRRKTIADAECKTCGKSVVQHPSRPRKYCDKKCWGASKLRTADDFWSRVQRDAPDACWDWTGSLSGTSKKGTGGYGTLQFNRRSRYAHHIAWELTYGLTALWILHKCDNRRCCNPRHLYEGTHADNMRDMVARGRSSKGQVRSILTS